MMRMLAFVLLACAPSAHGVETVSVTTTTPSIPESGAVTGHYSVARAAATSAALVVKLAASGTWSPGVDAVALPATVTIPANATSVTVDLLPIDDAVAEPGETVVLTVQPDAAYTVGTPAAATITLLDDDLPVVTLAIADGTASEPGTDTGRFTVTRTGDLAGALYVGVAFTGTATPGRDYQAPEPLVYLAPGAASASVVVTALDDQESEPSETVVPTLLAGAGYALGSTISGTITIKDDDAQVVTIVASDANAREAGPLHAGQVKVSRTGSLAAALTVALTVGGTATPGTDYLALPATAIIAAGAASATVAVTPLDDALPEGPETVVVQVAAGAGYTLGASSTATVTIADDEQAVSLAVANDAAREGTADIGSITVVRTSTNLTAALIVLYAVTGTATAGTDYTALSGSITIPANAASATIAVVPKTDAAAEPIETVVVTLTAQPGYAIIGQSQATVQLLDASATLPTLSATATAPTALEGGASGTVTFTRSPAAATPLTVAYAVGGTATPGADYLAPTGSVTIPANAATATVAITPVDDALVEGPETVVLTALAQGDYTLGATPSATVTINDNDLPLVTIAATDAQASEPGAGFGTGTFTVSRLGDLRTAITIPLVVSGTAVPGADYAAPPTSVTIPAGAASAVVTVSPLNDAVLEPAETVVLGLVAGSGYTLGAATTATVAILDDEPAAIAIAASDPQALEQGLHAGVFTLTRLGNPNAAITVNLAISGTATSGSDYAALPTIVAFAANVTSVPVPVAPLADSLVEGDETVIATVLSGTVYAVSAPSSAQVVIVDAATGVALAVTRGTAREGGDPALLTLRRTGSTAAALTVHLGYSGTAQAGVNLVAMPATVVLPAGTAALVLPLVAVGDAVWKGDTVTAVTVHTDPSYWVAAGSGGVVTVIDYENRAPDVRVTLAPITTATTTATFDASASTDPDGDTLTYKWEIYYVGVLSTTATLTADLRTYAGKVLALTVSDGKHKVVREYPIQVITTPLAITPADAPEDGGILIVDSTTVTMDGAHAYFGVRILGTGAIVPVPPTATATGAVQMTVASQVFVDANGKIDASGKGYLPGYTRSPSGPTTNGAATIYNAGSHGGYGYNNDPNGNLAEVYGDFQDPSTSGGGGSVGFGFSGGGVVRVSAGTLTLNGRILADGQGSDRYAGSAGGSIALTLGTLGGSGTISAKGGSVYYSSGGGGRIAVSVTTGTIDATRISAAGGSMGAAYALGSGGAGSIFLRTPAAPAGVLLIAGSGLVAGAKSTPIWFGERGVAADDPTPWSGQLSVTTSARASFANLTAASVSLTTGGAIRPVPATISDGTRLQLTVTGELAIDASSAIDATGCGLPAGYTWGPLGPTTTGGSLGSSGASHGGYGVPYTTEVQSEVYDSFLDPAFCGAGGGASFHCDGGGLLRVVCGTLNLSGQIVADGQGGALSGGGAGGGISLVAGAIIGTGTISAKGGTCNKSCGGGGRIAFTYSGGSPSTLKVTAAGGCLAGSPTYTGGAGTIYLKKTSDAGGQLIVSNDLQVPAAPPTPLWFGDRATLADDPAAWSGSLLVKDSAAAATDAFSAISLTLATGGVLRPYLCTATTATRLKLVIAGTVAIDNTSRIDATGCGLRAGCTWSVGGPTTIGASTNHSAGTHAGFGCQYSSGVVNEAYGSFLDPDTNGSGGAVENAQAGGGVVRITAGTLNLAGGILADGQGTGYDGGAAGGSIAISVSTFANSGTISAKGGSCMHFSGGGGRIALNYTSGTVDITRISAAGGMIAGSPSGVGGAGTIYLKKSSDAGGQLIVANATLAPMAAPTPLWFGDRATLADDPAAWPGNLTVRDFAAASTDVFSATSITISNNSALFQSPCTPTVATALRLTVVGAVSIDATSRIDATGCGLRPGYTWSAAGPTTLGASVRYNAAGHGGYGAQYVPDVYNEVYGAFDDPQMNGSGGAADYLMAGGGLVRISASSLVLAGTIVADGQGGGRYGGGAGGGVNLSVTTFSGAGTISARGGSCSDLSGGGGRIALTYASGTVDVAKFSAAGGSIAGSAVGVGGAGTIYVQKNGTVFGTLLLDNAGQPASSATPIWYGDRSAAAGTQPKCPKDFSLIVRNGALFVVQGDATSFDADGDNLAGWEEYAMGTNPHKVDTNDDGIPDDGYAGTGLDPVNPDADGDGVSNLVERQRGTSVFNADSDGDGVPDGVDVLPLDPRVSSWPAPSPTDTTPPTITITSPSFLVQTP